MITIAEWIAPIYDRTAEDVAQAQAYNKGKNAQKQYKGTLNAEDLNRIENNCNYIAGLLCERGYGVHISVKTNWQMSDIITLSDFIRLRDNITLMLDRYIKAFDMRELRKDNHTDYIEINDMERDLARIKEIIACMDQLIVPTGAYKTSGVGYLKRETYGDALISADDFTLCDRIGVILCAKEKYE